MAKNKDREQLRLLNCGDDLELSKFKKRVRLKNEVAVGGVSCCPSSRKGLG